MGFELTITKGRGQGKRFYFEKDVVRVGRLPDNDLVLYDTGVSRYHCEVLVDEGTYTLRDTGSSNGTLLNDVVTTEGRIAGGDRIGVGPITFVFSESENTPKDARRLPTGQAVSRPADEDLRREMEEDHTTAYRTDDLAEGELERGDGPSGVVSVARTATGSFMAYRRRVTGGFSGMPRSTRTALVAATALVVTAAVVSAYIISSQPKVDRSAEVFQVGGDTALRKFGAGRVDIHTPDRANFRFNWGGGRVTIGYAAGRIESPKEVAILVNEKPIGYSERASKFKKGLSIEVPRSALVTGTNLLTFDNTRFPGNSEDWMVTQVQVAQQALPPPDVEKATELFELGKAAFDTRSVAPQNLYKSIEYMKDALLHLEGMATRPPLYAKVDAALTKSEQELDGIHNHHMFTAQKAARFGDMATAVDTLRNLLRYYPDPDARRHLEVKKRLGMLLGE